MFCVYNSQWDLEVHMRLVSATKLYCLVTGGKLPLYIENK